MQREPTPQSFQVNHSISKIINVTMESDFLKVYALLKKIYIHVLFLQTNYTLMIKAAKYQQGNAFLYKLPNLLICEWIKKSMDFKNKSCRNYFLRLIMLSVIFLLWKFFNYINKILMKYHFNTNRLCSILKISLWRNDIFCRESSQTNENIT